MSSGNFPFDKLLKMLLIVLLIALPLGLYSYNHVKQQTDYLNQRNFRALNEIILQYQNHFEALSNLFKFPPPSKKFLEKGQKSERKHWTDIQANINNKLSRIKTSLSDYESEENIQEKIKYFNAILQKLGTLQNSLDHLNGVVEEETRPKQNVSSGIKSDHILQDTSSVQGIENFRMELIAFGADSKNDSDFSKWITAQLQYIKSQNDINAKEIQHLNQEIFILRKVFLKNVKKLSIKLNENILVKQLETRLEDVTQVINYLENDALTNYEFRLRLNESLGDIIASVDEEYTAEDKCFTKVKFQFLDNGSLKVESSACGFKYTTSISSLMGNITHDEFDAILLVDQAGKVLFSKELTALRWREGIYALEQTNYTGLAVNNIKYILENAVNSSRPEKTIKDKPKTDGTKLPLIGLSTEQTENIGGQEYKFFIQPFKLNYDFPPSVEEIAKAKDTDTDTDTPKPEEANKNIQETSKTEFYMIGLVKKERFRKETLSIPTALSAVIFIVLFFGVLSWPAVKLNFIGTREHITLGDLKFLLISLFITAGVIALFFISLLTMELMEKRLDKKSVDIGVQITDDFNENIIKIVKELNIFKIKVFNSEGIRSNKDIYQDNLNEYIKDKLSRDNKGHKSGSNSNINLKDLHLHPHHFPRQRDVFSVNDDGILFQDIRFFVKEFYTALKLNISTREYFTKTRNGKTWHVDSSIKESEEVSGRIYLQRIRNYSDGVKSTQFIMPISANEFNIGLPLKSYDKNYQISPEPEKKRPIALASTSYFQSLIAPVLAYGFNYAIIDDRTGIVLFHSQEEREFSENFYSETEYNNELIAAIKSGKEHRIDCYKQKSEGGCANEIHYSIAGKYHSQQMNFHVKPLKTVPWTLVTFYPKELAHSIAIESGVTSFIAFLLYTAIFYILILLSRLCSTVLRKTNNSSFSCAWFWPQKEKRTRYIYVCLILIPFSIFYALGVYYFRDWSLIAYLLFAMTVQLLLIYLSLKDFGKKPKDNSIKEDDEEFKSVYVLMVVMVLLVFSIIPSIALYKDSLSFYSDMYTRQAQIDVAQQVQARYSKLGTFAKLFFPPIHGQSNGYTKCSHFDFSDTKTGIFGLIGDLNLALEIDVKQGKANEYGCYQKNTVGSENQRDTVSEFRVSRYLFRRFSGYYLYLSQQYTTSLNNFVDNGWRFKGNKLLFNTIGIQGWRYHEITSKPVTFSAIFATFLPDALLPDKSSYSTNESLSGFAIFAFLLTFCILFPVWFYRRVSFIVRQIFAIDLSTNIVRENRASDFPTLNDEEKFNKIIEEDFPLSERCYVLINGDDKKIKCFCCEKLGIKKSDIKDADLNVIKLKDHLGRLEKFIKVFTPHSAQDRSSVCVYILPDFMYATSGKNTRKEIRIELEKLLDKTRNDKNTFILICAEVHPLHCMDNPKLFTGTHIEGFSSASYHKEKHAWVKILCNFVELDETKSSEDQKYPQYRKLWSVCNLDERLMLYQLANDRFVNPKNHRAIEALYSRGYIERDPYFKIPCEKFKEFIKMAEPVSTFHQWEKDAAHSIWTNIKIPLFIMLVFLAGLFIYISTDALETTLGLMTPLLAIIPLLLRSISTVQAKNIVQANDQEMDSPEDTE